MPDPRRTAWGPDRLSRRQFLLGTAAVAAAGGGTALAIARVQSPLAAPQVPICMAMHVHASASEGVGSMESQLVQAAGTGVEVIWWTEHDHRMAAHDAPRRIDFTGMHESGTGGAAWTWVPRTDGDPAEAGHDFRTSASEPDIAPHDRALRLHVRAQGKHLGTHSLSGQAESSLSRTSLAGLTITVDVRPTKLSRQSFVAINVVTSFRPATGGRRAGLYVLSYRVGGAGVPGVSKVVDETTGIVYLAAALNRWTSLTLKPEFDLTNLWPDTDGRDASLHEFALMTSAHDASDAEADFARLQFRRTDSEPLARQSDLMRRYAGRFPTVRQFQALEVSLTTPHIGWYGGRPSIPDYADVGALPVSDPGFARAAVDRIHRDGGLASYCHPYGVSVTPLSDVLQESARAAKSAELVRNRALGCDLLEVGYRLRGGCTLAQHESLWDNCSRNGIFLTGVGVSDDHSGMDWRNSDLNFVTWAWSRRASEAELIDALRTGRVFFGDVARFDGALDIRLGDRSAMGGVVISTADDHTVTILATGLPHDVSIELVHGTVDFAGPTNTDNAVSRTPLSASQFDGEGRASVTFDTRRSRFVRVVVKDSTGLTVALSNPVWLLRRAGTPAPPEWRVLR